MAAEDGQAAEAGFGFRPLYQQVKQRMIERMLSGEWAPGAMLPSEQQIAAEIGVSQGTVRKALDALHAENLVVRRQGRGTFVAQHTAERAMFHFFKLTGPDGAIALPETVHHALSRRRATALEAQRLGLPARAPVWELARHRALGGEVVVSELITLPADAFPGLEAHEPLPNNVYSLYETHYGRTVARADEQLSAVGAPDDHARPLGLAPGAPVLLIDRTAYGLDNNPVELRRSLCRTDTYRYRADLR
jgi:GntR family transcriptional regulator